MPPKALKQILFKIESVAQFLEKVDPENKKLCGKLSTYYTCSSEQLNERRNANHFRNSLKMFLMILFDNSYRLAFELVRTLRLH